MRAPFDTSRTAADLRRAFDDGFAAEPPSTPAETVDLLAVRIGGERYALSAVEITGLVPGRPISRLPSRAPELLGLAAIRGSLVPVYSLAALLGHEAPDGHGRWFALAGADHPVALAVDELEGHLRISRTAIRPVDPGQAARGPIRDIARGGHAGYPVIDVPSILDAIRNRAGVPGPAKEKQP